MRPQGQNPRKSGKQELIPVDVHSAGGEPTLFSNPKLEIMMQECHLRMFHSVSSSQTVLSWGCCLFESQG